MSSQVHPRRRPATFVEYFILKMNSNVISPPIIDIVAFIWRHALAWTVIALTFFLIYYVVGLAAIKLILGHGFGVTNEDAIAVMLIGCLGMTSFFAAVVLLSLQATLFNAIFCGKGIRSLRLIN